MNETTIKHEKYAYLFNKIKKYSKPIILMGPVGCGRSTAIKQIAEELKSDLYYLSSVENSKDFLGIDNLNTKDVPSNFFLAYIKGGILYVDDVSKRKADIIAQLIDIASKDSMTINKKKYEKHKNFKVVLSCDIENDLIANYMERTYIVNDTLECVRFDYDTNIEKSICSDNDFYDFFLEVRKVSSDSIYNGTTTTALSKCSKLLSTPIFTAEDIVKALLINGYDKASLEELYENCKNIGLKNKYLAALKNLILNK